MTAIAEHSRYPDITGSFLGSWLHYDPLTGEFTKIGKDSGTLQVGDVMGYLNKSKGYCYLTINRHKILAHRIAYLYMTGKWPEHYIDHINGFRNDNRWSNLRAATNAQNLWGSRLQSRNTSGYKGVIFSKNRWQATIDVNGKRLYLGRFKHLKDAIQARKSAEQHHHGVFGR